jgi:hypothetical protein
MLPSACAATSAEAAGYKTLQTEPGVRELVNGFLSDDSVHHDLGIRKLELSIAACCFAF